MKHETCVSYLSILNPPFKCFLIVEHLRYLLFNVQIMIKSANRGEAKKCECPRAAFYVRGVKILEHFA